MAVAGSRRMVLFDIDGTLLSIAERELNVFGRALERSYGTTGPIEQYCFAGKTDHQITFELLSSAGLATEEIEDGLGAMMACYFEMLATMLETSSMVVLPGVVELLDELAVDQSVVLGLQTGNWEPAAELKLSRFGLDHYFVTGGFGDGHHDRHGLPTAAQERLRERLGHDVDLHHSIVIGDTALDIACARRWDMSAVGVATGSTSEGELHAAGADLVVPTLADLDATRLLELGAES